MEQKSRPTFDELKQAAQPLVDILYKYYDPHTTVIVDQANVEVVIGDMAVPNDLRD